MQPAGQECGAGCVLVLFSLTEIHASVCVIIGESGCLLQAARATMRTESAGQVAVLLAVATLVSLLLVACLSAEAKNTNHRPSGEYKNSSVVIIAHL